MNFIYIVAIIILMAETECFVEDTTSIKISEEQRTLLRKLQNFEDPKDKAKPLTWNEMLADVLVNRVKIFSFKADGNDVIKEYSVPSKPKKILTDCFSEILLIFKNYIYDKWIKKYDEPEFVYNDTSSEPNVVVSTDNTASTVEGPKGEIEIIEPRYHGKLQEADSEEDIVKKECPEGAAKDDKGKCVREISKLLISVPNQCPIGYRPDSLGNCRMIFF